MMMLMLHLWSVLEVEAFVRHIGAQVPTRAKKHFDKWKAFFNVFFFKTNYIYFWSFLFLIFLLNHSVLFNYIFKWIKKSFNFLTNSYKNIFLIASVSFTLTVNISNMHLLGDI